MTTVLPNVDLTNCDKEPIHIPGQIQSHGMMFVLSDSDLRIEQVSSNTKYFINLEPQNLLGKPFSALVTDDKSIDQLKSAIERNLTTEVQSFILILGDTTYQAVLHKNIQDRVILELEPEIEGDSSNVPLNTMYDLVSRSISQLENVVSLEDLYDATAKQIRELTGFDRIMIYRFSPQWHGTVVAESKIDEVDSFLGLRFPASDIPTQARDLYVLNRLRFIVDVNSIPIGLVHIAGDDKPLDMSYMTLRAVSPIHIEYLQNMGIGSSMSISILKNGQLWGLIACHHRTAFWVSYHIRAICKLLSLTLSTQLIARDQQGQSDTQIHSSKVQSELLNAMNQELDFVNGLTKNYLNLQHLINSDGAAIWYDNTLYTLGATPNEKHIIDVVNWLEERGEPIYYTDHLSSVYEPALKYKNVASGLLAIKISHKLKQYILWFRQEHIQMVDWGGNPAKAIKTDEVTGEIRISPRQSFKKWSQEVEGMSLAWKTYEVNAAITLRSNIIEVILRRVNELKQLNTKLERSNIELDAFAYIASHDLKEPLRGIHNYASILVRRYSGQLGEDGEKKLHTLVRLTQRLDALLDSLLHYSRVGRLELDLKLTDLNEVIENVKEASHTRITESSAQIVVPRSLPTIVCDTVQITEVFANLISNGIKYNNKIEKYVEVGFIESENQPMTFYVKDNGIGIPEHHIETVFGIFKRLHQRDAYGGGVGVGLTIVEKIVQRHNGKIWVKSYEGQGSIFYFTVSPENDESNGG